MATNNAFQAKTPKELLLQFLEKSPRVYSDAIKWTLLCWSGISFSSLFKDSEVDRESLLRELQQDDSFRVVNDPKGGSEVMLCLTKKGRDEIVDVFYSKKEKRELKRLFKKLDSSMSSLSAHQNSANRTRISAGQKHPHSQ